MGFNFYGISRFEDSQAIAEAKWTNIVDFIEKFGIEKINDYLSVENNFIDFLRMFYINSSTIPQEKYGLSLLGFCINVDNINDVNENYFYGLEEVKKNLYELAKININYISEGDLTFLLRCWVRELCSIYFFEVGTGSFLRSSDESFTFTMMLHQDIEVSDIFEPVDNVYIHEALDPNI